MPQGDCVMPEEAVCCLKEAEVQLREPLVRELGESAQVYRVR